MPDDIAKKHATLKDPGNRESMIAGDRFEAAGVPIQVRNEPPLVHAFIRAHNMSALARTSFDAIIEACASLAHRGQLPSEIS